MLAREGLAGYWPDKLSVAPRSAFKLAYFSRLVSSGARLVPPEKSLI